MIKKVIWAEKYRPQDFEHFCGQDAITGEFEAIADGKAPMQHFLFYSKEPGTGKTSMAYLLAKALNYQLHKYNASSKKQRGIEFIEEEISLIARSGQHEVIILLDEADQLTPAAQSALKGVIEDSSAYFILTCNDITKVSPWLKSRCQLRTFLPHTEEDMSTRLSLIATLEGHEVPKSLLLSIMRRHPGDMRNCIGALQAYCSLPPDAAEQFANSLSTPQVDCDKLLRLCFKEGEWKIAYTLLESLQPRQAVRTVFRHAVNSTASPAKILKVVEASVITERDLLDGVDPQIALYNFLRLLCSKD
jgi:DNA polymerase III delta prime subunit